MSSEEGGEEDLLFGFLNASDTSQLLHIIQQQQRQNESIQVRKLSKKKTATERGKREQ